MRLLLFVSIIALSVSAGAKSTHVRSYTKKNGTHVQSYMKTTPDDTMEDNYSTKGNVNPYTGKPGTVDPVKKSN